VIAQPLALLIHSQLLPPFESWHGGVLPYPLLLATQVLIIAWFARTAWRFGKEGVVPRYRLGVWMLALASAYFGTMLARLVLGMTVLSESRWFSARLPTAFHLVLATWVLLYGHFHFRYGARGGSWLPPQT
jgi:hypothetical protein